jgi:hypothetical protein
MTSATSTLTTAGSPGGELSEHSEFQHHGTVLQSDTGFAPFYWRSPDVCPSSGGISRGREFSLPDGAGFVQELSTHWLNDLRRSLVKVPLPRANWSTWQ